MFTSQNVSCVMCHLSHVTCHVSHVTCHILFFYFYFYFLWQSGKVYWWRVCYQRGLPRLVILARASVHGLLHLRTSRWLPLSCEPCLEHSLFWSGLWKNIHLFHIFLYLWNECELKGLGDLWAFWRSVIFLYLNNHRDLSAFKAF